MRPLPCVAASSWDNEGCGANQVHVRVGLMTREPDASSDGERAADELLPLVYDELHALAEGYLRRERKDHTLQPTALINEVYLKLVGRAGANIKGKTHFKAIAAEAMRQILIDHGRRQKRQKRGGNWHRVKLDDAFPREDRDEVEAQALNEALDKLRANDDSLAEIVVLRLLGGMTVNEVAEKVGVSPRTVNRELKAGLAWLRWELSGGDVE